MVTRRTIFNLDDFLQDLSLCFEEERYDLVHDTVQKYKDFLKRSNKKVLSSSMKYVNNHHLVTDDEVVSSYIRSCHKPYF